LAEYRIVTPLTDEAVALFRAGDNVLITGSLLAAGDEAHRRPAELIRDDRPNSGGPR
jgi:fumarate hydratase subunit beta